jgi:hypothetical protein
MKKTQKISVLAAIVSLIVAYLAWEVLHFASSTKFQIRNFSTATLSEIRLQLVAGDGPQSTTQIIEVADLPAGGGYTQRLKQEDAYLTFHYKRDGKQKELDCGYVGSTWDTYLVTIEKDATTSRCELLTVRSGPGN